MNQRLLLDLLDSVAKELEMLKLALGNGEDELVEHHMNNAVKVIKELEYEIWHSNRVSGIPYKI